MYLNKIKNIAAAAAIVVTCQTVVSAQQLKTPQPSPICTVKQTFALSEISVEYSRPSTKGRNVFGELVPFGEIWRTGANASTKITFGEDVKIDGQALAAGTYALYTIPAKDSWTVIFHKNTSHWGTEDYAQAEDALRITVKPTALAAKVETFTINVADITSSAASVELLWASTRVAFNVVADIDSKIMKNIETTMGKDARPYYASASYYFENNKDLKQAAIWVDKGIEQNPKAYWMVLLKAKIQAKQNEKAAAVQSAEKVKALAAEDKNDDYVRMAEKFIKENSSK